MATVDPESKLSYALRYAAIGWHVFPVNPIRDGVCACGKIDCREAGKHPIGRVVPFGQNQATTDAEQIKRWWRQVPDANIGVLLSKSSLCAIDIDPRNGGFQTLELIEDKHGALFSDVLQYTGGGGEHRVFALPQGLALPGTLGPGIDVKANGYIVVEPSSHISGNAYAWEGSSAPYDGNAPSPLPDWIRDLAFQRETQYYSNDFVSRFVTPGQIEELRSALHFIDADNRDTWIKVGHALKSIGAAGWDLFVEYSQRSPKFRLHEDAKTWRSFSPTSISYETIFYMAQEAGWINTVMSSGQTPPLPMQAIIIQAAEPEASKTTAKGPQFFPVAILNELAEWMESLDDRPTRAITIQGVLALTAVLAGRIYKSTNSNDSSLFLMTLAPTGYGKGYPAKAIKSLLTHAGLPNLIKGAGNTSASAVFSALRESPCHIQISDEIGKQYQAARKQHSGMLSEAFAILTSAYSETDSTLLPRNFSTEGMTPQQLNGRGNRYIINPSITLFGFATFEQVFDSLTHNDIDDGFLNRQIIVNVDEAQLPERERQFSSPPGSLIEWVKSTRQTALQGNLGSFDSRHDILPTYKNVLLCDDAKALFRSFKDEARSYEGDRLKMTIRWTENAMRMATGMAVADNCDGPVISTEIAQWCIDYVRYHGVRLFDYVEHHIADNETHRLRNQILKAIENAGSDGRTYGALVNYCRLWKGSTLQQRDGIIESLKREGLIVEVAQAGKKGLGRKPSQPIYYHSKFVAYQDDSGAV